MDIRPIDANALLRYMKNRKWISGYDKDMTINHVENYSPTLSLSTSLNTLRDEIYQDAVAHGLWEEHDCQVAETIAEAIRDGFPYEDPRAVNRSWAMEPIRKEVNELEMSHESEEEYAEELADVIIMSMSVAGKLGIDIDAAIRRKMEINKKRPWKHGKTE